MPLNAAIVRDGKPLPLRWGGFHVCAMIYAIAFETKIDGVAPNENIDYPTEPQGLSPKNVFETTNYFIIDAVCPDGRYMLKEEHRFQDITDGDILHLKPGDELRFSRSHKS